MFRKILIANRGEIACRVIATAKRLGVETVAVYSDADAAARHVAMADEAVRIGPPAAAESYLQGGRLIAAAQETGAEAIHPGYGFLSENPDFVEAVEAAGLVFIGPPAAAIRAMGLKDAAKALMAEAGAPVVPGYHGATQDPDFLAEEADKIGYPVLIKARAGGGGKGMRRVDAPAAFKAALESARREAEASFGDPACLVEKFISHPRHIEIQVFADAHGAAIHLCERDCSLQRRHQKVIEEAPAPDMPPEMRAAMGAAAVAAARTIGYEGAGTVEFIVDGSGPLRTDGFWFMEMNTRLQVEHPVTEAITGLDLVEMQLRIAAGEPLPIRQEDVAVEGWAVEARLYAEDAAKGFLPATGVLEHLVFPEATEFAPGPLRIDSGVRAGDAISAWYDPMIAKVIAHGPTRAAAFARLAAALDRCEAAGCVANAGFLRRLVRDPDVLRGRVDTGLIERGFDALAAPPAPTPLQTAVAAAAALDLPRAPAGEDPWDRLIGWRHWEPAEQPVALLFGETRLARRVAILGPDSFRVSPAEEAGGEPLDIALRALGADRVDVRCGDLSTAMTVLRAQGRVTLFSEGDALVFAQPDPSAGATAEAAGGDVLTAPMPGLVKAVSAAPGERVARGAALMVMEAMKMEHTLAAPRDGVVAEVLAAPGDQVADGALLLRLEETEDG